MPWNAKDYYDNIDGENVKHSAKYWKFKFVKQKLLLLVRHLLHETLAYWPWPF